MEGVLLFLFRLGSLLLMPVGQGSLFGLVLSEVVVDPVSYTHLTLPTKLEV